MKFLSGVISARSVIQQHLMALIPVPTLMKKLPGASWIFIHLNTLLKVMQRLLLRWCLRGCWGGNYRTVVSFENLLSIAAIISNKNKNGELLHNSPFPNSFSDSFTIHRHPSYFPILPKYFLHLFS